MQQAALLGHKGVTVASLKAKAQCDRAGPNVPDRGPGADWICVMSWHDKNVDETLMPGKFEINAHSNDCYTAGGPSKLVGLLTITDKNGKEVPNPAFHFDGCFDPHGSNKPTSINLNPKTPQPTTPAALAIAAAALHPDNSGLIQPALTCSPGQEGCGGTIAATLNGRAAPNSHLRTRPRQERQHPTPAQPPTGNSWRKACPLDHARHRRRDKAETDARRQTQVTAERADTTRDHAPRSRRWHVITGSNNQGAWLQQLPKPDLA